METSLAFESPSDCRTKYFTRIFFRESPLLHLCNIRLKIDHGLPNAEDDDDEDDDETSEG